jgi:hypothetical protein
MRAEIPDAVLSEPTSEDDAERWLSQVIEWVGSGFDPESSFVEFEIRAGDDVHELAREHSVELDRLLGRAKKILGRRLHDLAYREALAWMTEHDRDRWRAGTAPPPSISPAPRWWLVERDEQGDRSPDPTTGVAYEDAEGGWWIWDPATHKLHSAGGWMHTDYYYRARAHRDRWVETEVGRLRFSALTPDAARRLMASNGAGGVSDPRLLSERRDDPRAREAEELLREPRR